MKLFLTSNLSRTAFSIKLRRILDNGGVELILFRTQFNKIYFASPMLGAETDIEDQDSTPSTHLYAAWISKHVPGAPGAPKKSPIQIFS